MNHIIQLIDVSKKVVRSTQRAQDFVWDMKYLSPGRYRIRVIDDADGNGRWTTGDFAKLRLPESVYISEAEYAVRANWSLEEILDLSTPEE